MGRLKAQNGGTVKRLGSMKNSTKMQRIREYCCLQANKSLTVAQE